MGTIALTGGATGIGAATRKLLESDGHQVIVVDIKSADIVADLSRPEGREQAIEAIRARAPEGLDGFVACAGVGPSVKPASKIASINYFGTVVLAEALAPLVAQRRGAMVLTSSNSAPMGSDTEYVEKCLASDEAGARARADEVGEGQSAYGGAKLALTRWMRRHSTEYAKRGLRMNAVAPGITQTPLTEEGLADKTFGPAIRAFGESVPTGGIAEPEQIASVITFLLGPGAKFMCGAVVFVDGGHDAMLRPDEF